MERVIIFRNTETGEEMVMPVTPKEYQLEHGRKQNTVTMHTVGDVTFPGPAVLLDEEPEFMFPRHAYPFNQPGTNLNPFVYLEKLEKWSDAGTVLRWVVSGTPINAAVRLGPIRPREQDGTNDVYCVVPIRGVRQLAADEVELSDGVAPLAARLGAYNGIKNINLIRVGQVLQIPDKAQLPGAAAGSSGKVNANAAAAVTVTVVSNGPYPHHGNLMVAYVQESGAADMKMAGKSDPSVTVKAKRGSKVNLALAPNNKGRVAYFTLDGKTVSGSSGTLAVTADKDHKIGVYWGA